MIVPSSFGRIANTVRILREDILLGHFTKHGRADDPSGHLDRLFARTTCVGTRSFRLGPWSARLGACRSGRTPPGKRAVEMAEGFRKTYDYLTKAQCRGSLFGFLGGEDFASCDILQSSSMIETSSGL